MTRKIFPKGPRATSGSRARAAALLAGAALALLLAPGEARAQATCEGPNQAIPSRGYHCTVAADGTGDLVMSYEDLSHTTTIDNDAVIEALYGGPTGKIDIDVRGGSLAATGETARGISAQHSSSGTGTPAVAIDIDLSSTDVRVTGEGIYVFLTPAPSPLPGRERVSGEVRVRVTGGSITSSAAAAISVSSQAKEKIDIDLSGAAVETTGQIRHGVYAYQNGGGDIEIDVEGGSIKTAERLAYGVYANMRGAAKPKENPSDPTEYESGDIRVTLRDAEIEVTGSSARGVYAYQQTTGRGHIRIDARGGSIKHLYSGAPAVHAYHRGATGDADVELNVDVHLENVEVVSGVVTEQGYLIGASSPGVHAYRTGGKGRVAISVSGGSVRSEAFYGVYARHEHQGEIDVRLSGAALSTGGTAANYGILAYRSASASEGGMAVRLEGGASIRTTGVRAYGVWGYHRAASGGVSIDLNDAIIETTGSGAYGVWGYVFNAGNAGDISIRLTDASISTTDDAAHGVLGRMRGGGDVLADFASGRIRVEGFQTAGMDAEQGISSLGTLGASGAITPYDAAVGRGSIDFRVGAEARVESPFFIGARGRLFNHESAAARLLVNHAGVIEARDAGIFAWATRMSGHTFGEGAQTADDASRTEPMIHVVSSGDVTVGLSVMDDFIRNRIAGDDGALSDPERAVLSAVTEGDWDALAAAFEALPDSYDEDWKAEAQELLRKRNWTPTSALALAHAAADEVLGFVPTGIRVLVLDHEGYARYLRVGDIDPALASLSFRTPEQRALYDEQQKLSEAERAVLEALLLGGDLEAALARLTPLYTDYKDVVRSLARRYNAGDVRVDVTGGTIAAEGDGVYARYAIPHERNGAIAVNVGQGARVTGGRNGLWVGGAGAGEGNFLAQSVTVDGTVAGGTGAGVYMKGGGRLAVGETGRVSAESGAAILADGPGDFHAAIAGRVEGDVRSMGAGAFTAAISGMVEGDVTSMGDMTATISGMVTGDVEGLGAGDHTVTVSPGGEVAGVIHLAASSVVVDGRVCAVILDAGGVVTVGASGVVKELEGVSIRAGGGTLRVEVSLGDRPLSEVVGGAIVLAGGEPDIFVNGVRLSGAAEGGTGAEAPNGARDVRLIAGDAGVSLVEAYAPRAGVYESLPGLLLRMESGRARGERTTAPGLPVWVRLSAEEGSRGASRSTSSAKYDFDSRGLEAGLAFSFPWREGLAGSLSVRHQKGSAETSLPDGKGKIDLAGVGLGAGLSWERGDGWRLRGEFSVMDYDADLTSGKWGKLRSGVDASVRALDLEASRRFAPGERLALSPRVWLTRSVVSMDGFTDTVGARVRLVKGSRFTGGIGAVAETARPVRVGGGTLALRGSLDLSEILSGSKTSVRVTGERLHAEAEKTRLLLGIGARWLRGRFSLDAALSASGQGAGDETFAARLGVGMRF